MEGGLRPANIDVAGPCTACHTELLFSFRAEKGVTGRMMAAAGIRAD
jgi:copper oxidase (laccase) domain-containing protein